MRLTHPQPFVRNRRLDACARSVNDWYNFNSAFGISAGVVYFPVLFGCYTAGATRNCCRVGARSVYTTQPLTSFQCHFIRSICTPRVHACLAVTCHLHFWHNDRGLVRTTAVTRGWDGYRNMSQHKKVDSGQEHSPAAPAGTRTCNLSITGAAL